MSPSSKTAEARQRRLFNAGIAFAIGSALHAFDHLRRGQGSISDALYVVGNVGVVVQVVTIVLILTRHQIAAAVSVAAGFTLAIGFIAAHWLPHWSSISDPVWKIHSATWFSYVASTAEIIGAFAVGFAGLAIVREDLRHTRQLSTRAQA
jgi:hypothetical protein